MSAYQIIDSTSEIPLVSIAMLTYNHQDYIVEALDSVLMQKTKFSFKIILAEDQSTDKTRAIILDYQREYPDIIKLILQNENVGASKNNISLFENLEGKYIAALEGDDYWTDPLKLQKQVDFLESNLEYGLVHTNYNIKNEVKNIFLTDDFGNIHKYENEEEKYLFDGKVRSLTVIFRKEFINDFLQLLKTSEFRNPPLGDRIMFLLIASKSKIKFLTDITGVYRISINESASNFIDKKKYFVFALKVANLNYHLVSYLKINNLKYLQHIKKRIYFLEFCELLLSKQYFSAVKKIHNLRISLMELKGIISILLNKS